MLPGSFWAFVKLDFRNAFNSIHRDKMLASVLSLCPSLYPFVYSSYSSPSSLFWGNEVILSAEGVQQGDPLGPLLFCITHHDAAGSVMLTINDTVYLIDYPPN